MKSIFGGMNASISCECSLYIEERYNDGRPPQSDVIIADPTGEFYTPYLCQLACYVTCANTLNCIDAVGRFNTGIGIVPTNNTEIIFTNY
jgi:hypothetical protein